MHFSTLFLFLCVFGFRYANGHNVWTTPISDENYPTCQKQTTKVNCSVVGFTFPSCRVKPTKPPIVSVPTTVQPITTVTTTSPVATTTKEPVNVTPVPPVSVPVTTAPPVSVPVTTAPPVSVPVTPAPPVSVPVTPAPPVSVPVTPAPPVSVPATTPSPVSVPVPPTPHVSVIVVPVVPVRPPPFAAVQGQITAHVTAIANAQSAISNFAATASAPTATLMNSVGSSIGSVSSSLQSMQGTLGSINTVEQITPTEQAIPVTVTFHLMGNVDQMANSLTSMAMKIQQEVNSRIAALQQTQSGESSTAVSILNLASQDAAYLTHILNAGAGACSSFTLNLSNNNSNENGAADVHNTVSQFQTFLGALPNFETVAQTLVTTMQALGSV